MKKLALLLVPLILAGCNLADVDAGGNGRTGSPYTITMRDLGYSVDDKGKIIVTAPIIELNSAAGAGDVRHVEYVGVLYDARGKQATVGDSIINPKTGTLFANARGGYKCVETNRDACRPTSEDAYFADTNANYWPENRTVDQQIVNSDWAVAHMRQRASNGDNGSGWYVEFTFIATQANGKVIGWKQRYQFVAPT